jgi:hypothetical protein
MGKKKPSAVASYPVIRGLVLEESERRDKGGRMGWKMDPRSEVIIP